MWSRGGRRGRAPSSTSSAQDNEMRGVSPRSLPSQRMLDPRETCYFLRIRPSREGSGNGKHPLVRWWWRMKGGGGGVVVAVVVEEEEEE